MTPKDKAKELANKFVFKSIFDMTDLELIEARQIAKQCALIAVDEIIQAVKKDSDFTITYQLAKQYWQQVKQEIQAL